MDLASRRHEPSPEPLLYEATLQPHRSLGRRGFAVVMAFVALVSFVCGLAFLMMGAWPIFGFFGLDVLAIYIAFRMNFRAARAREEITMTPSRLLVRKVDPAGRARDTEMNPLWTRLHADRHEEFGLMRVLLQSRGTPTEVGSFLHPQAKEDLSTGLGLALAQAKRGVPLSEP
ncbi:DUF2244 domain-containing protein [Ancylobacter terrae]|uniref:DUF2244 domain-containing protein n=1 Tax=Ancylobacter sp. sgz301288 TaxID=3342077 RepID=UPI00385C846D